MLDNFVVSFPLSPGKYQGQVMNVLTGMVWECEHKHTKHRSAKECAKAYASKQGIELEPDTLAASD